MFLHKAGTLYQVTQRYIPNGRNLQQIKQRPTPFISFPIHPKMRRLLNTRANDSVSKGKGKGKGHSRTGHESPEGE
jgi:hypothetical protein